MRIFAKNNSAQIGMTLVETLVALAILSLATGIAAGAVSALSPRLAVERAADQLIVDLKRARLEAETSGAPINIEIRADGYSIDALSVSQVYRSELQVLWDTPAADSFAFNPGFDQSGSKITITKGKYSAEITVAPISGKITRAR